LVVKPTAQRRSFDRLQSAGGCGIYGFYEALDYTPIRLPEGKTVSVVKAQFAHHQGMSLVALTNALVDDVMRQRFHRHPMIEAADLLLQERTPREIVPSQIPMQESQPRRVVELVAPSSRRFHSAHLPRPCAHLLSNGRYTVMVTAAGAGFSTCDDLAVTRGYAEASRVRYRVAIGDERGRPLADATVAAQGPRSCLPAPGGGGSYRVVAISAELADGKGGWRRAKTTRVHVRNGRVVGLERDE